MGFFEKQHASRFGTTQTITFTSTGSVAISNAFGSETYQLRLVASAACNVKIGDGAQTATTNDPFFAANAPGEYVTVTPGQRLSTIGNSTAGTLWVTEVS